LPDWWPPAAVFRRGPNLGSGAVQLLVDELADDALDDLAYGAAQLVTDERLELLPSSAATGVVFPPRRRGRLPGQRYQQRVWPGRERTLSNALNGQAGALYGTGEPDRPRWVNYGGDEAADTWTCRDVIKETKEYK
jgi:hypothetical protein